MARIHLISALAAGAFVASSVAVAQQQSTNDASAPHRQSDPYPLSTCPVSGKTLGKMGDPVVKEIDGREVRFCCPMCIPKFEADKEAYWKKIDAQIVEDQVAFYPLTTCVISGEPLTMDGDDIAVDFVYNNRLVRFCCRKCVKTFLKDPDAALAKLDAATAQQQRENYPLERCPVSGGKLGMMGDPYEVVIDSHLVRLCCPDCETKLRANPQKYLEKLDEAWKAQGFPTPTATVPEDAATHQHDADAHGGH